MGSETENSNASIISEEASNKHSEAKKEKPSAESTSPSQLTSTIPLGAPAKHFYLKMFDRHAKQGGKKEGGGRDVIKVSGTCKICGKVVTGTDSYFLFKQHYQTAHQEALVTCFVFKL